MVLLLVTSCSTTRVIKPLEKGEWRIAADAGGPFAANTPIPLTSISAAHGLTDKVSLFGGLHTSALSFNTLQLDLGANFGLLQPQGWRPGISANLVINPMVAFRNGSFRIYPETTVNAYWTVWKKSQIYLGFTQWYDWHLLETELDKSTFFHPNLQVGYQYEAKKWVLGAEYKWLNFNKKLLIPQTKVNSIGGYGGYGIYLKVAYRFNRKEIGDAQ
ncbi:hypothetical protein KFE98_18585 [bacterium SCSIO 12741]|nr:hypothetical protein KFE98_18585 [bacterium SCSIO 12741]